MPCLHYLSQLREAHPDIQEMGADVIAVATGAGYQAERLMANGTPFPCLVDPERHLYRTLGIERIAWRRFVEPATWRRYWASRGEARQGRITGDARQAPGVAVIGADRRVLYLHRGETLADYPPLAEVLAAARTAASGGTGSPEVR